MTKANIPTITGARDLAALLGMSLPELYSKVHKAKYRTFTIPKRSSGFRVIEAPEGSWALIQRRLAFILADAYGTRSPVHGFTRGKGIRSNAKSHLGAVQVFTCDIKDFFPSIHFGRVRGLFMGRPYGYPLEVANLLARICCHRGSLPQGAPTSPIISNMMCGKLDSQLKHLARQHRCQYTRYADDLTFYTTLSSFPKALVDRDATGAVTPGTVLTALITNAKFSINPLKTRLMSSAGRKEVTGVVIGSRGLNLRRSSVKQLRCMLHAWETCGLEAASTEFKSKFDVRKRDNVDFAAVVRGKLEHLGYIKGRDNEIYIGLLIRYLRLHPAAATSRTPTFISPKSDATTRYRSVYVLKAILPNEIELLSTAFWLEGFGLVTANHAVRDLGGETYTDLIVFRDAENIDGVRVVIERVSEHHDLAILRPEQSFRPLVMFKQGPPPPQQSPITLIGYPNYNPGNPVSITTGHLIRQQVDRGIGQIVISPIING